MKENNDRGILMRCEYCNQLLDKQTITCPSCGAPVLQTKRKDLEDEKRDKKLKRTLQRKALWQKSKRIIIGGFIIIMIIGVVATYLQRQTIEYKAYSAATKVIEKKWRVSKLFDYKDAEIFLADDKSGYYIYGVIQTKVKDTTHKTKSKSIKCFVSIEDKDTVGNAVCDRDIDEE